MSGHTPGPWAWDGRVSVKAGDKLVALVYAEPAKPAKDEWEGVGNNASLIAAAPDLLEALIAADRTFAENGLLACHAARKEVQAAIARATGEAA